MTAGGATAAKSLAFVVPGDLATPTGGYVYDRRIVAGLPAEGWSCDVVRIGEAFPYPSESERADAMARLLALPEGLPLVIDGLAFGTMPDEARTLRGRHPLVALVHHPLALETGVSESAAAAFRVSERAALACADRIITTSHETARVVTTEFGVAADRVTVVLPGIDRPAQLAEKEQPPGAPALILSVGAVTPRKGFDVLIAALAQLADLPWRLVIVGDPMRSVEAGQGLVEDIARFKLVDRVELIGAIEQDRLSAFYASADLFVLASRYEGYGMAFAEAICHGLPVVGTTAGAIPGTVPPEAGVLVPPDDAEALAAALRALLERAERREALRAGALSVRARFPTWQDSAARFAAVLDSLP